jgi:hypothetical protein
MKRIVFNATITTVSLAMAACSFVTMPAGRALSEQKKLELRGLTAFTVHCKECTPGIGGKNCTYNSDPNVGDPCFVAGDYVVKCDGRKGDGTKDSETRDVYFLDNKTGDANCIRRFMQCQPYTYVDAGVTNTGLHLVSSSYNDRLAGCGEYTTCNSVDTSTPDDCKKKPPLE